MGREGETPAQIFWHIGVQKKWYKLSKLGGGGGGRGNLDKIRKKSYFFREPVPNINEHILKDNLYSTSQMFERGKPISHSGGHLMETFSSKY